MTDKMSDVIYVYDFVGDTATAIRENNSYAHCCIRQDSIADIDGLDDTLEGFKRNGGNSTMIGFETIYKAAKELQRIKGVK